MSIRKKNTLYRIYPKLTKRKLVKKLPRLALAFLGFLEPLFDLIVIPLGKNFNPKLNKEVISFYEDHFTALEEEELRTYPYVDLNEIKIYFVNDSSNLHEEGSTEYFSNILFKNKNDRVQLYFDNNERELNQVLGLLYDQGIQFKEYRNGQRTFLMKQPKYKELQEIKKKYDLEW